MKKKTVLILEDDKTIRMFLTGLVGRLGGVCSGAVDNGADAVTLAKNKSPDIVIIDAGLAGKMTGFEAAEKIRSFSCAPFIFTTAADEDELKANLNKGLEPYELLKKPYKTSQITKLLEKYF